MDRSALSRVMNGKRGLAGRELIALAQELQTSVDWILLGEEPFPVQVAARHDYLGKGSYVLDRSETVAATVRGVAQAYEQAGALTEWPNRRDVPSDPREARQLLELEFGPTWPRHFADAVERTFGIDVIKADLPGSSGLSLKLPNAVVIVVPTEAFWARQNWTIAHELEHIASGAFSTDGNLGSSAENAAHKYAAELLLPASALRGTAWEQVTEAQLANYVWHAGVSVDALQRRLAFLRLATPATNLKTPALARKHILGQSVFDDPVAERLQEAAARRFPVRLIAAHEGKPKSARTLEWMLGAPFESGTDDEQREDDASESFPDMGDLAAAFGLKVD
jgi:hypothetical protein